MAEPFHPPPQEGHKQVVDQLLKAGADKDKAEDYGCTPLYIACQVCVGRISVMDGMGAVSVRGGRASLVSCNQ